MKYIGNDSLTINADIQIEVSYPREHQDAWNGRWVWRWNLRWVSYTLPWRGGLHTLRRPGVTEEHLVESMTRIA